jgi:RNA polymerase-binding transcription factor DksA
MLTREDINRFTQELTKEKGSLIGKLSRLSEAQDQSRSSTVSDSGDDNQSADSATQIVDREMTMTVIQKLQDKLDKVSNSLDRIYLGQYGTCSKCSGNISKERLEAIPTAQFCLQCELDSEDFGN